MNNEFYFKFVELWKKLCEIHSQLYDFTCDEYSILLSGEIEQLELLGKKKEKILLLISSLDSYRQELILNIQKAFPEVKMKKVRDVIEFFQAMEQQHEISLLKDLNELLMEMIEKIKDQNKKNQIFLHKSIQSFEQIRTGLQGNFQHRIYNSKGHSIGLKSS